MENYNSKPLFGFSIEDKDKLPKGAISPIPQNNEDGVDWYLSSGFFSSYVDIEGAFRTEAELIRRYREMALHPEVDGAIEDIVNEAIVSDTYDSPVEIELSNLNASDGLKKKIRDEFKNILQLLDFDKKCHEIYRNWYIDGRVYYHKVIDLKDPKAGILDLRYIDSLKIRYIRKERKSTDRPASGQNVLPYGRNSTDKTFPQIDEYFEYNPQSLYQMGTQSGGVGNNIRIAKDSIAYCNSGLVELNKKIVLSYLHKSIKSLNQLRMIEDSLVIYRLSRAPERRIFYIDVGNLPKQKAEQYMQDVMRRYRNKQVYDSSTGQIKDDKKFMSFLEDFWLPRREGGRGTQVDTLPGGQNLGEIKDIEYFKEKLYRSLNVPPTRMQGGQGFNMGRSSEILRDELKFTKFVGRLRKRFSDLFNNLLSTQLILKNIITPEDWVKMNQHIQYDFLYDNHFSELKDSELMTERLNLAATADPYVGIYYSRDFVRRKILRQTDQEIIEQDKIIKDEIAKGVIPDPNAPIDPETGMPLDGGMPPMGGAAAPAINGQMGKVPIDQNDREPAPDKAGKSIKGI
jgi:hypothetical protein